ncbi:MAG: hypothetical protein PHV49_03945, partial [Alistipes sp.]|nr:hypothetical protein [Alistipes sp.]
DVSTLDFTKVDYVINRGYSDALDAMPMIKERITRRVDPDTLTARRLAYRATLSPLIFDHYKITGLTPDQTRYVEKLMQLDQVENATPGKKTPTFGMEQFRSGYFKIVADGDIEGGYPDVWYDDTTHFFDLQMEMKTKPSLRLSFGGNISSTSMNQAYVGLEYHRIGENAQTYNFDGAFSPLYSSLSLRGRTDFFVKRLFSLDYGYNFNYYNYFKSNFGGLTRRIDLTYSKYLDNYLTTAVTLPIDRHSVLSFRVNGGYDRYNYFQYTDYTDADIMDRTRFSFVGLKLEMDRNALNYVLYPTRGLRQSISAIWVAGNEVFVPGSSAQFLDIERGGGARHWFGIQFIRENYFTISKWFSLGYLIEGTLSNHPSFDNEYATNITSPAFTPTPHSKFVYIKEFRSSSYLGVGVMPTFEFSPKFYLKNSIYLFVPEDYAEVKESIRQRIRYLFSTSLVYQSFVGPVSLTLSKYDASNRNNWFLTFNIGFTIFNRNGLFY